MLSERQENMLDDIVTLLAGVSDKLDKIAKGLEKPVVSGIVGPAIAGVMHLPEHERGGTARRTFTSAQPEDSMAVDKHAAKRFSSAGMPAWTDCIGPAQKAADAAESVAGAAVEAKEAAQHAAALAHRATFQTKSK